MSTLKSPAVSESLAPGRCVPTPAAAGGERPASILPFLSVLTLFPTPINTVHLKNFLWPGGFFWRLFSPLGFFPSNDGPGGVQADAL